ncbi:DUF5993 family protein [Bartonella callosciuri]|uniref:DUF5993 family protein n=1 Tax=Bartonella callosciuri TaxID=686223 RepID=UPI0031B5F485
MFVPFLIALATAIMIIYRQKKISYTFWVILFSVTLFIFNHHVISTFNLSF